MPGIAPARADFVRTGRRLEYFTIAYNSLEGLIGIAAGVFSGSIALVGFGVDSIIEVVSGAALLWSLREAGPHGAAERTALRIVGACFCALALYITYDSLASLLSRHAPERSIIGIVLAATSLIVMPLLARAKRIVAGQLGSAAMHADAKQSQFCTYLSAILMGGLLLNALFGLSWADPAAALVMVPVITHEGVRSLKGRACPTC